MSELHPTEWTADQPLPDGRQEAFCRAYVRCGAAAACAVEAGYATKNAKVTASRPLTRSNLLQRIRHLQNSAEDHEVMALLARKIALSKIARGEVATETEVLTQTGPVKLRAWMLWDRIAAIQELNKLDGAYKDGREVMFGGAVFEFIVRDSHGREIKPLEKEK
jgi:phage terminase small subunit